MGYDRIVYIRYHFSCGLDRKDACWLSFTPLTGCCKKVGWPWLAFFWNSDIERISMLFNLWMVFCFGLNILTNEAESPINMVEGGIAKYDPSVHEPPLHWPTHSSRVGGFEEDSHGARWKNSSSGVNLQWVCYNWPLCQGFVPCNQWAFQYFYASIMRICSGEWPPQKPIHFGCTWKRSTACIFGCELLPRQTSLLPTWKTGGRDTEGFLACVQPIMQRFVEPKNRSSAVRISLWHAGWATFWGVRTHLRIWVQECSANHWGQGDRFWKREGRCILFEKQARCGTETCRAGYSEGSRLPKNQVNLSKEIIYICIDRFFHVKKYMYEHLHV